MRYGTRARTSAATFALFLLLPTVFVYSVDLQQWTTRGYWASVSGQLSFGLRFIGPACAACAAWEAARLRRGRVFTWAPARHPLRIALDSLSTVYFLGLAGLLAGLAALWPTISGAPGGPDPAIAATWLAVIAGHAAWGYLLGSFLTLPVAFPLAAVTTYVWMAYPGTLSNPWIRHLNGGDFDGCCRLDQAPSLRVVAGVCLLAVGVVVAGGPKVAALATALAVFAVAATGGVLFVRTVGTGPVQDRAFDPSCVGTAPRVCLWPEQSRRGELIRDRLRASYGLLVAVGVSLPPTLTSARHRDDSLWVPLRAEPTRQDVVLGLAESLLPGGPPECAFRGEKFGGFSGHGPTLAWLALTAGADPVVVPGRLDRQHWEFAARVRTLPAPEQVAWYSANREALTTCGRPPVPLPAALAGYAAVGTP
ncbi:hypothetical protein [Streptomyces sp. SID3343]|uniref:DUF7224 domain-containing protein n=1 Tax=Streptomyces sp. SID3343 TaxID=2690260 RepID=UPI00136A58DC|nr:hypothetical protein [Streptomyces sp. SID3343]MYW04921.1 hypothetical protein [Streptomyces sp. SID3343]